MSMSLSSFFPAVYILSLTAMRHVSKGEEYISFSYYLYLTIILIIITSIKLKSYEYSYPCPHVL